MEAFTFLTTSERRSSACGSLRKVVGKVWRRRSSHILEAKIRQSGRMIALLDTNRVLTNAIALYERCGYEHISRYNDNPYAHFWFRKNLVPPDG